MRTRSRKDMGVRRHYRTNTIDMNELMHIILSLQIMFGSRRAVGAILAILLFCGIGYLAYTYFTVSGPQRQLEQANQMWDNDEHVDAIREYKKLLRKRDPVDPNFALLPREDRPVLFRRIITHEAVYGDKAQARDWISVAYSEGINFEKADFERESVFELWKEVIADSGDGQKKRDLLDEFLDKK